MALMCARAVMEVQRVNTRGAFRRYFEWWDPSVDADDKAFDTGATLPVVFEVVKQFGDDPTDAAEAYCKKTGSAGINGAHRTVPLALCACISDEELPGAARADCKLTHAHSLSCDAAAACAVVLRELVKGSAWRDALAAGSREAPSLCTMLDPDTASTHASQGGFAPQVVAAVVCTMDANRDEDFDTALQACLDFAGADNYSPVIAGAWLGAMHGSDAVADRWLDENRMLGGSANCKRTDARPAIRAIALELAQGWTPKAG